MLSHWGVSRKLKLGFAPIESVNYISIFGLKNLIAARALQIPADEDSGILGVF